MYGKGAGYSKRSYVLYDGIHYDAVALGTGGADKTIFSSADADTEALAVTLAKAEQAKKKFVDVGSFTLRCLVCSAGLKGQDEAQTHAQATGHQNFAQY